MGQIGLDHYRLIRPLLFSLDAERTHLWTLRVIDRFERATRGNPRLRESMFGEAVHDPVSLLGLRFPNRVGLAAGLDKNAQHLDALSMLGFGFIEAGTVTPLAQPGNDRPRLFRLPQADALINRFGFNNIGLDAFLQNVENSRLASAPLPRPVLGLNIGKNAATPIDSATQDYCTGLRGATRLADYITVNVSSPNTKNLRTLQSGESLDGLLKAIDQQRARLRKEGQRDVPVLLKIAPDLDDEQISVLIRALTRFSFDGVVATNTTIARDAVQQMKHGSEQGGLSGSPVREASVRVVRALRQGLPAAFPIIGVGGIFSGDDAVEKLHAGADLVQLYTGLVYRGPALVRECALALKNAAQGQVPQARGASR